MTLRALDPFFALAAALREAGFAVSPDQTESFIAGIGVLGPHGLHDVRSAALAIFAIPPERRGEFDAIFSALFEGQTVAASTEGEDDESVEAHELTGQDVEVEVEESPEPMGDEATGLERLGARDLVVRADDALANLKRRAPEKLPRRLTYRRRKARRGDRIDLRRALRMAARQDGDVMVLPETRRKTRQRRIVVLVDVSGSMKSRSDALLLFAHALSHAAHHVEVFTLGTRLTRITSALSPDNPDAAMARVAQAVADIDGGTRIGEALAAFLDVPRYAGLARGALVLVLSDGLERGDPSQMVSATGKLSRLAWRLNWLTPLAGDPDYTPQTEAILGVLPWLDVLADGSTIPAICDHLLDMARAA